MDFLPTYLPYQVNKRSTTYRYGVLQVNQGRLRSSALCPFFVDTYLTYIPKVSSEARSLN